jgi:hypothetical protein
MMLIFTYGPYTLAEGIHLSGKLTGKLPCMWPMHTDKTFSISSWALKNIIVPQRLKQFKIGIMAILFCGIGMSHYTHFNLSPITQITMQQTMRTLAFIAGKPLITGGNDIMMNVCIFTSNLYLIHDHCRNVRLRILGTSNIQLSPSDRNCSYNLEHRFVLTWTGFKYISIGKSRE